MPSRLRRSAIELVLLAEEEEEVLGEPAGFF
jgi:hypothetical protein